MRNCSKSAHCIYFYINRILEDLIFRAKFSVILQVLFPSLHIRVEKFFKTYVPCRFVYRSNFKCLIFLRKIGAKEQKLFFGMHNVNMIFFSKYPQRMYSCLYSNFEDLTTIIPFAAYDK